MFLTYFRRVHWLQRSVHQTVKALGFYEPALKTAFMANEKKIIKRAIGMHPGEKFKSFGKLGLVHFFSKIQPYRDFSIL